MIKKFILIFLFIFNITFCFAQKSFEELTLQEKIGQTIFVYVDTDNAKKFKQAIEKGLVGGILIQWGNYSLSQTKKLIDTLQEWASKSPSKIPLLIALDYEGGTVYTPVTLGLPYLPTNMALAAANNLEDTATLFYIVARELRNIGVNVNFAPVIDVNVNPSNPIIGVRSFGANSELVGNMGLALIEGLQKGGVAAVAKHFPGHGETILDSHKALPSFMRGKDEFDNIHLPPFQKAIEGGVYGVMTAHIIYEFIEKDKAATFAHNILTDLLKDQLGFKGVVFTDSLDMVGAKKVGGEISKAATLALSAGADALLCAKENPLKVNKEIESQIDKLYTLQRIEDASKKIYELKQKLGLFEQKIDEPINTSLDAYNFFAKKLTQEAVTIVRGKEGVLPYTKPAIEGKKQKLCAVFFSPSRFANQLPEIVAPFHKKGWEVSYYNAPLYPKKDDIKRAQKCIDSADLTLLGSMQWADKPIKKQQIAFRELLKNKKDIIFISLLSPYDIAYYPEAKNVMALYGVNELSSQIAGDIILGNIKAVGHLPIKP